jgi:hypothetical protein
MIGNGNYNTFLGTSAATKLGCAGVTICNNTILGARAAQNTPDGICNTYVGYAAAFSQTAGNQNVVIGPDVQTANFTGSCQLAIGFANGQNWLTGDSTKNIKPGAGIRDCANSVGTAGQVLTSTGTALQWSSGSKQFLSASLGSNLINWSGAAIPWTIDGSSGVTYTAADGSFGLTAGRTYLINAGMTVNSFSLGATGLAYVSFVSTTSLATRLRGIQMSFYPTNATGAGDSMTSMSMVYTAPSAINIRLIWLSGNGSINIPAFGAYTTITEV